MKPNNDFSFFFSSLVIKDDFREQPASETDVAIGHEAVLHCKPPRGEPEPKVRWEKEGQVVELNSRITVDDFGTLKIEQARKDDAGTYICVAHNSAGERESSPATLYLRGKNIPNDFFQTLHFLLYSLLLLLLSYACSILHAKPLYPAPYTIISLLSFHHCSSQPSQYPSVSSCAYTRLLNESIEKQRLSLSKTILIDKILLCIKVKS